MSSAHIGTTIAPAATSQTTQTTNGGLKGNPPKVFTGDRTKSDGFLLAFRLFKAANRNNEQMSIPYSRVTTTLTYMEGETIEGWKESQLDKLNDKITTHHVAETSETLWTDFEKEFKEAFTNTNKKMDAYRLLKGLKHGDNLDVFLAEFKRLVASAGINIDSHGVIELLKEALKPGLTQAVIHSKDFDPLVDWTFQQWADEAQKQDSKWNLAQQSKQGSQQRRQTLYKAFGTSGRPKQHGGNSRLTTSQGGNAMDVNATTTQVTLSEEEKAQRRKNNECFYCAKEGHNAKNCRKRQADRQKASGGSTNPQIRAAGINNPRTTKTSNPPAYTEAASTAPVMTTQQLSQCLQKHMDTLDDDTKLKLARNLLPQDFMEARN